MADKSNYRKDCFAYKDINKCAALTTMNCYKCKFYKKAGTELDSLINANKAARKESLA